MSAMLSVNSIAGKGRSRTRGIVAAGHPATAETATEILAAGGNAFDAALGALLTCCLAEPMLASLGGGGFLLARPAHGEARLFDFFTQTPLEHKSGELDFYPIHGDFGGTTQEFHIGMASIACPGVVRGVFEVHRALGRLPLARLIEPAAHLARTGLAMTRFQAFATRILTAIVNATPEARRVFRCDPKTGVPIGEGEIFELPEYADFLETLVREGDRWFYEGEPAETLARDCAAGGYLTREDLARYRVEVREPLTFHHRGATIRTNPPPSLGGVLIAFSLALLGDDTLEGAHFGTPRHLVALAEAMAATNQARREAHAESPEAVAGLLDSALLAEYHRVLREHALVVRGTSHVSVADAEGNLASLTVSNGEGSGYLLPGTGVMLNNMLGEEDLSPAGFHTWPPATRLASMMAPSILEWGDGRFLALGSGGSNRLRTAILQVLVDLLDFRMPIEAAITAPRLHYEKGKLHLEPGFPPDAVAAMRSRYPDHRLWPEQNLYFGGVHSAGVDLRTQKFFAAADTRRAGEVREAE